MLRSGFKLYGLGKLIKAHGDESHIQYIMHGGLFYLCLVCTTIAPWG